MTVIARPVVLHGTQCFSLLPKLTMPSRVMIYAGAPIYRSVPHEDPQSLGRIIVGVCLLTTRDFDTGTGIEALAVVPIETSGRAQRP